MSYLKVITGPMFSGKTEEMIRVLRRFEIVGKKILVLKPKIDHRTSREIASRRKPRSTSKVFKKSSRFPAVPVGTKREMQALLLRHKPAVLGIDEAQFFGPWIVGVVSTLLKQHATQDFTVVVAGLDMDAWGRPFGVMPELLALADEVKKETAVCFVCKQPAVISQKLGSRGRRVEVGDFEMYQARCRVCHDVPT
jgi:thymidine kinase